MTTTRDGTVEPRWLDLAAVKAWLRLDAADVRDDDIVAASAAAVEPYVERSRPEFTGPDGVYTPNSEVRHAAVMMAARVARRRNSPGGIETMAETVTYVASWDPDIDRALHRGRWAKPSTG